MSKTGERWAFALFFLLGTTVLLKAYALYVPWGIRIVFTPSIPPGLYASKTFDGNPIHRGQSVCFYPPQQRWMQGRSYFAAGEVICKFALGVPGDVVEQHGDEVFICRQQDCTSAGKVVAKDAKGRDALAAFSGQTVIPAGHYYMGSTYNPKSFDSRYLGLVSSKDVTVKAWPLWTY